MLNVALQAISQQRSAVGRITGGPKHRGIIDVVFWTPKSARPTMRGPAKLSHRFIQYSGRIAISSVTLAEHYSGASKHSQANRLLSLISDLRRDIQVIDSDSACAEAFEMLRGKLLQQGISVPTTSMAALPLSKFVLAGHPLGPMRADLRRPGSIRANRRDRRVQSTTVAGFPGNTAPHSMLAACAGHRRHGP
jgi:predicted nucleic acid-binding protein